MGRMLTIQVDEDLRAALRKRAAAQGKSVSKVVREILSGALEERPLSVRVGHLRGQLELPSEASETSDAWQIELRERSWRP
jgi:plasmid stability protein